MAGTITPCLWFDTEAEAAARFYTSIFAESAITYVSLVIESGATIEGRFAKPKA